MNIHFNKYIYYLDTFKLQYFNILPRFCVVNSMCICRLSLLWSFEQSSPTATLFFSYTFLLRYLPYNSQLTGFQEKDARDLRVIHAEPLMGLYTIHFSRLSTIYLLYLLVVVKVFYHIYAIAISQLHIIAIFTHIYIWTHEGTI